MVASSMNNRSLISEQLRALSRFPIPLGISLTVTLVLNLQLAHLLKEIPRENEVLSALAAAFLAALAIDLWATSRKLSFTRNLSVSLVVATLSVVLQFDHGENGLDQIFFLSALMLAVMVAAHLRHDTSIESLWQFDLRLGIALATGGAVVGVFCGGVTLLAGTIAYLFDVKIAESLYMHLWTTGFVMIAPVFSLAMIVTDFDQPFLASDHPGLVERAIAAILNLALAPLVLAYALMLHVYAFKIAITATMPKRRNWTTGACLWHRWHRHIHGRLSVGQSWFALGSLASALLVLAHGHPHGVAPDSGFRAGCPVWHYPRALLSRLVCSMVGRDRRISGCQSRPAGPEGNTGHGGDWATPLDIRSMGGHLGLGS